jgi:uncharacterized membrane protein YqhA
MLRNVFAKSRYLILIAVIGSLFASVIALLYGGLTVLTLAFDVFTQGKFTAEGAKPLALACIEVIDLFLLGTVLYIVALGLYELFIDHDLPMPHWLVIANLDDLEEKLTGIVVVLLAVTFLANVVTWNGNFNILALGIAVGLVLFALGYLLNGRSKTHRAEEPEKLDSNILEE